MGEFHILYSLTSFIVKIYKWLELNLLIIFTSRLERKLRGTYKKLGVKFSGAGVTERLNNSEENLKIAKQNKNTLILEVNKISRIKFQFYKHLFLILNRFMISVSTLA